MTRKKQSNIIIPNGLNIWPHELKTAQALVNAGFDVEFLKTNKLKHSKSPDIRINDLLWEIKSPKTDKLSAIERNLKRATRQSPNIIIDSQRMSKLHDSTIQRMLIKKLDQQKAIKNILFINRRRQVVDISIML